MNTRLCVAILPLVAACSSSSGGGASPSSPEACQAESRSASLLGVDVPAYGGTATSKVTHVVVDVLGDGSALLRLDDADGSAQLSFLRPERDQAPVEVARQAGVTVVSSGATYGFTARAIAVGNRRCVLYVRDGETLRYACEGSQTEDSKIKMAGRSPGGLTPVLLPDGTLWVFGQGDYASYDAVKRTNDGKWSEVDKMESSVSWAGDALEYKGSPVVCFIGTGETVGLDVGGTKLDTPFKASRCRIVGDASSLHLLAGSSYVALPWSSLSGLSAPTFDVKGQVTLNSSEAMGPLVTIQGKAHLLVDSGAKLEARPLAGGASIALGVGGQKAYHVRDGVLWTATSASSSTDSGPYFGRVTTTKTCL